MKVFVINGSPKGERSNTYRLTSAFLEGMESRDELTVETVVVNRLHIEPCLGCFCCWNKTPGQCVRKDDMEAVIEKMLWADVIVWSFPLYYFSVPGPLKNLMDRQLPMTLPFMSSDSESGSHPSRYDMSGKRNVVISTCGFYTAEGNYDGVTAMFDHICGKGLYTPIFCGQGELFRVPELHERTDAYLDAVRNAGAEFCSGGISVQTRAELGELLYPRAVFEAMADASWGVEKSGEKTDETLTFTRQMAALYNKSSYDGKDRILEMVYTDSGKRYQIILGSDGSRVLTEDFAEPTTTIETPFAVWKAIASGEISGEDALMQQKYRVKGDFQLMIFWDRYFGSGSDQTQPVSTQKPTNMALLLVPWIAFWILTASMNHKTGAVLAVLLSALAPLVFAKNRLLIYDRLSAAAVTVLSMLVLVGAPMMVVLPVSYFCFGAMWTVNGFTRIPLTAHYSQNDYGGEKMLSNPLFIKTNRILTLCWGLLYLAMTLWTVLLLPAGASWVSTVNSILPAVMSIFTIWFQRWYPVKIARGN